jgi:hypothetical protein
VPDLFSSANKRIVIAGAMTRKRILTNGESKTIYNEATLLRKRLFEKNQPSIARKTTITTYATGELK